jgi:hypothetical protein
MITTYLLIEQNRLTADNYEKIMLQQLGAK